MCIYISLFHLQPSKWRFSILKVLFSPFSSFFLLCKRESSCRHKYSIHEGEKYTSSCTFFIVNKYFSSLCFSWFFFHKHFYSCYTYEHCEETQHNFLIIYHTNNFITFHRTLFRFTCNFNNNTSVYINSECMHLRTVGHYWWLQYTRHYRKSYSQVLTI